MKATMAKRKIQQVLRHQFLTNKILSHWTAPFQVFSSTIIFLFTFDFSRPKQPFTTEFHILNCLVFCPKQFGCVQNTFEPIEGQGISAAMGDS